MIAMRSTCWVDEDWFWIAVTGSCEVESGVTPELQQLVSSVYNFFPLI
jgi:hypothetical protein